MSISAAASALSTLGRFLVALSSARATSRPRKSTCAQSSRRASLTRQPVIVKKRDQVRACVGFVGERGKEISAIQFRRASAGAADPRNAQNRVTRKIQGRIARLGAKIRRNQQQTPNP
jgi:hypothetical protein